jgi:site-specific recombinase XerD
MARKTQQNSITSPELISKVNPENIRLLDDFIIFMRSVKRSEKTIGGYQNDIHIFFVWNLKFNKNKFFVEITKRDIIAYQNWITNTNGNSPARIRRLKSALASMSNYIENILDEDPDFKGFKKIVNKIENPANQAVREKTVFTDEQLQILLDYYVGKKQYIKACATAICMCSGARKSEIVRYKVSYFTDENIIYGSLYKTPEKMITKGRNGGKLINRYILANQFKPYLDLWLKQREELGVEGDWLFSTQDENGNWVQMNADTLNSWAETATRVLSVDFYWHSLRHYFCTHLAKLGLPDSVIIEIIGWESADMVKIYNDISADEQIGKYFDENGIKEIKKAELSDL